MNIAWYSYNPNPWKDCPMKMWVHHADIIEILSREIDINIFTLIKPSNLSKIKRYENGDKSVIVDGYQNVKFNFMETEDASYLDCIDACFLEVSRMCIFGISDKNIRDSIITILVDKIKYLMNRNIPIIWYDGDGDLYIKKQSGENFNLYLYNVLDMKSYEKCTVIGPYEIGLSKKSDFVEINNFKFVPYNINFDKVYPNEIESSINRSYLSTYFGNNFRRSNFVNKFNTISNSECGTLRIYGKGWDKSKLDNKIELNNAITLTIDEFINYYNESLIGIYGSFKKGYDIGHYTLRITEYLKAGIYIVPDDVPYLIDKFPSNNLTIKDFYSDNVKSKINFIKNNYINLVEIQRKKLSWNFDSKNLYKIYKDAWEA